MCLLCVRFGLSISYNTNRRNRIRMIKRVYVCGGCVCEFVSRVCCFSCFFLFGVYTRTLIRICLNLLKYFIVFLCCCIVNVFVFVVVCCVFLRVCVCVELLILLL